MRAFTHFLRKTPSINFIGRRWWGFALSGTLLILSAALFMTRGLNTGIDFAGGLVMEIRTEQAADLAKLRETLSLPEFGEISLQHFGTDREVMIRASVQENTDQQMLVDQIKAVLDKNYGSPIEYRKVDYVGPMV